MTKLCPKCNLIYISEILPLKDADNSMVIWKDGTYNCIIHGAMNKLTKTGIWRCVSAASFEKENMCKAGFQQDSR